MVQPHVGAQSLTFLAACVFGICAEVELSVSRRRLRLSLHPRRAHKPQARVQVGCPLLRCWVGVQVLHPCLEEEEQGHWLSGPQQVSWGLSA